MCGIIKYAASLSYLRRVLASMLFATVCQAATDIQSSGIKFAFYSSAWTVDSDDGLRLVLFNETDRTVNLSSIVFQKNDENSERVELKINEEVPPFGYSTAEFDYIDLLQHNDCIERTLNGNWKLTEISNYTLNPAVRNLIIEDTDSFRIYQCLENVRTFWSHSGTGNHEESNEWIIFHFETK